MMARFIGGDDKFGNLQQYIVLNTKYCRAQWHVGNWL